MNLSKNKKTSSFKHKLFILVIFLLSMQVYIISYADTITDESKKEVTSYIEQIFQSRNRAILNGNLKLIKSFYNMDTKYGTWAYEYEKKKMDYINNWAEKQGIKFTDIIPTLIVKKIGRAHV